MAASTLDDVTAKLKTMGKEKAEAYILKQKDAISKLAPDKRALLTSAYSQAFLGAQSTPSLIVGKSNTTTNTPTSIGTPMTPITSTPTPTTTSTPTPTVTTTPTPVAVTTPTGFTHTIGSTTFTFSPTKTLASGVAFNEQ